MVQLLKIVEQCSPPNEVSIATGSYIPGRGSHPQMQYTFGITCFHVHLGSLGGAASQAVQGMSRICRFAPDGASARPIDMRRCGPRPTRSGPDPPLLSSNGARTPALTSGLSTLPLTSLDRWFTPSSQSPVWWWIHWLGLSEQATSKSMPLPF